MHPFERYRETKFQALYWLTKNQVAALADEFAVSEYSNSGRSLGGGLSHRDRVGKLKKMQCLYTGKKVVKRKT